MCSALDTYSASDHLPRSLFDKKTGPSYDVAETAFQAAAGTHKPRWDWLEEKVTVQDLQDGRCGTDGGRSGYPGPFGSELDKVVEGKAADELVNRPELAIFGLAMVGGGRVFGKAHLYGGWLKLRRADKAADKLARLPMGVAGLRPRGGCGRRCGRVQSSALSGASATSIRHSRSCGGAAASGDGDLAKGQPGRHGATEGAILSPRLFRAQPYKGGRRLLASLCYARLVRRFLRPDSRRHQA